MAAVDALEHEGLVPGGLNRTHISVEPPKNPAHGDMASNAAMVLAAQAGEKPRTLAEALADRLSAEPGVEEVSVAGAGFLNWRLHASVWQDVVAGVLRANGGYANSRMLAGVRYNIEYVSADPVSPLRSRYLRGAVFGDALAALLEKAGAGVTREYFVNDVGVPGDILARSSYHRYREACGEAVGPMPPGLFEEDYLISVGQGLKALHGKALLDVEEKTWLQPVRRFAVDAMLACLKDDLVLLGVAHESFTAESSLYATDRIAHAVERLRDEGQVYIGTIDPPDGRLPEDYEELPQTLFRATRFGDALDRPLRRSSGTLTFFAGDIAYHVDKFDRGADRLIDVWNHDHAGYVDRMKAAMAALGQDEAFEVKLCGGVVFLQSGLDVEDAEDQGDFAATVLDIVGRDALRFALLAHRHDTPLNLDLDQMREPVRSNPYFRVQYAHVRLQRLCGTPEAPEEAPGAMLPEAALGLCQLMARWPGLVEASARAGQPSKLVRFLEQFAETVEATFDAAPSLGVSDETEGASWRALGRAAALVIAEGLAILGVEPLQEL